MGVPPPDREPHDPDPEGIRGLPLDPGSSRAGARAPSQADPSERSHRGAVPGSPAVTPEHSQSIGGHRPYGSPHGIAVPPRELPSSSTETHRVVASTGESTCRCGFVSHQPGSRRAEALRTSRVTDAEDADLVVDEDEEDSVDVWPTPEEELPDAPPEHVTLWSQRAAARHLRERLDGLPQVPEPALCRPWRTLVQPQEVSLGLLEGGGVNEDAEGHASCAWPRAPRGPGRPRRARTLGDPPGAR